MIHDLSPRMRTKQDKVIAMWTKAYDTIFSNPKLDGLTSPLILNMLKREALSAQVDDIKENFHLYSPVPLADMEAAIKKVIKHEGYQMAVDMINDFRVDIPTEQYWEA